MEANVAHYCLQELHKFPHEFLELPFKERAVVIASVEVRIENEKKKEKELEEASKK